MKKNSQIHFNIDTESYDELKIKAKKQKLTISEFCRRKVLESDRLERIEEMLVKIAQNTP